MAEVLTTLAGELETTQDLATFWEVFDAGLALEGFDFVIYVSLAPDGSVTGRANFPLYLRQPPKEDPFLKWCCESYGITLTGPEYLDTHSYLDEPGKRFVRQAGAAGFRSGFGLPVQIAGGGALGGFNLGTRLARADFETRHGHKGDALHKFCLLAHRKLDALLRQTRGSTALITLSRRERQVLDHMAEGLTRPQIAAMLGVSINTVSSHIKTIYGKLGVGNQIEAVRYLLASRG